MYSKCLPDVTEDWELSADLKSADLGPLVKEKRR